jgi:hypothetical protein
VKFDPTAKPALESAIKDEKVIKAVLDSTSAQMKKAGLKG